MLRGYSVATKDDGNLISKVTDVSIGENITLRVTDGNINAKVESRGG